ncbi:MAG: hypothetical protein ACI9TI_001201 [Natronomonas sp.]|jgi:uncharacterized protein (DUF2062 family)|uniref:DUF2062 domain-containing protein n=1 Tax=Natronomonas sp. TaxID=2184060 RepID=UPI00398961FC
MVRGRIADYRRRVCSELEAAFSEEHPSGDVAGSFAVGVFITALPTLGTGLLVFLVLVALVDRISKLALFASVVVLNPVVKWGVYAASFSLGSLLLGPVPGATPTELSLSAGPGIVSRLLVGNLILAVVLTVVGYVVVFRLVTSFRARDVEVGELLPDVGSE